jgi:hypothetical protein
MLSSAKIAAGCNSFMPSFVQSDYQSVDCSLLTGPSGFKLTDDIGSQVAFMLKA